MKKIYNVFKSILALALVVSLVACAKSANNTTNTKGTNTSKLLNDSNFRKSIHIVRNGITNTSAVVRGDGTMILSSMRPNQESFRLYSDERTKEVSYIFKLEQGENLVKVPYGDPAENLTYPDLSASGSFYFTDGTYTGLTANTYGAVYVVGDKIIYSDENVSYEDNMTFVFDTKTKENVKAPRSSPFFFGSHIIFSANAYGYDNTKELHKEILVCDDNLNVIKTMDGLTMASTIEHEGTEIGVLHVDQILNKEKDLKDLIFEEDYVRKYNYLDSDLNIIFDEPVDNRIFFDGSTIATIHQGDKEFDFDFKTKKVVGDVRPYSGSENYNEKYQKDREKYKDINERIKNLKPSYNYVETKIYGDKVIFLAYGDGEYVEATDRYINPCDIYSVDEKLLLHIDDMNVTYEDSGYLFANGKDLYNFDLEIVKTFDKETYLSSFKIGEKTFFANDRDPSFKEEAHHSIYDDKMNEIFKNVKEAISYTYDDYEVIVFDNRTLIIDSNLNVIKEFDRALDIRNWYTDKKLEYRAFTDLNTNRMGIIDGKYNVIIDNLKAITGLEELCFGFTNGFRYGLMDYEGKEICSFSAFDTMNEDSKISDSDIRYIE